MLEADRFFDASAYVYAHRGLWDRHAPENSLAAFQAARSSSVGVELDVRLTADGEPVVFHDATLERMFGDSRRLDGIDVAELASIQLPDGSSIPLLDQALDLLEGSPALLELKVDTPGDAHIADVVADKLKRRIGSLAVMSFDETTVARLCSLIEDRPVGLLIDAEARLGSDAVTAKAAKGRAMGCDYLAPHLSSLAGASQNAGGLPLVTWTLRTPAELEIARTYGAAPVFEGFNASLALDSQRGAGRR